METRPNYSENIQNPEKCIECPLIINAEKHIQSLQEAGDYESAAKWKSMWNIIINNTINTCDIGEPSKVSRKGLPILIRPKTLLRCSNVTQLVRPNFYQIEIDPDC